MEYFAKTDIGQKRRMNQDYIFAEGKSYGSFPDLFLLADGMGGHKAGDFASRYTVEELKKYIQKHQGPAVKILQEGIREINEKLYKLSCEQEHLNGCGTTLVAAFLEEELLTVANIGDSRAYLINDSEITQITRDHSYVEEMVRRGLMRRGSQEYMSSRNIITRAVGIETDVTTDFFDVELSIGDYFLLCSDGLSNMVDNESIRNIVLDRKSLEEKVDALVELANINGGKDNISVILVKYTGKEVFS